MSITAAVALVMLSPTSGSASGEPESYSTLQIGASAGQGASVPASPTPAEPPATANPGGLGAQSPQRVPAVQVDPAMQPSQAEPTDPATVAEGAPAADVVVTARPRGDPLRAVNARSFAATQAVDQAITGPAALAYKRLVPDPVRSGFRNFANNLHEPNVALNYLLQLKPGKAVETVGRFAINSTIGIAGLFDLARRRPFGLPRRPNGFADTLGYYGVGPGAFVFLPLIGPTTVRDIVGGGVDRLLALSFLPLGGRAYVLSTGAVRVLDRRAQADEQLRTVRESADPYESRRSLYMHKRRAEIDHLHGRRRAAKSAFTPGDTAVEPATTPSPAPAEPPSSPPGVPTTTSAPSPSSPAAPSTPITP